MPLRILTQNLYNGGAEPDDLAHVLDRFQPDLVAVQELSTNAARVLEEWAEAALLDPRDDTTGMGVAVRGPAVLSRLDFPVRWPILARLSGDAWGLPCDVDVINAHVMNPIVRPLGPTRRIRNAELLGLRDALLTDSEADARVVVGDLNSSPAWPLYRNLSRIATDAAKQANTAKRTWGPWPGSPRMLRIDHAFLRGPLRATKTQIVDLAGTDHSGLLVDIDCVRERLA
jgi:endonuclease/exonuclease/phosphatase family metal-dependent hydrolase